MAPSDAEPDECPWPLFFYKRGEMRECSRQKERERERKNDLTKVTILPNSATKLVLNAHNAYDMAVPVLGTTVR